MASHAVDRAGPDIEIDGVQRPRWAMGFGDRA